MRSALTLVAFAVALALPLEAQRAELVPRAEEFGFDGLTEGPDGLLYLAGGHLGGQILRGTPDSGFSVFASGFEGPSDVAFDSKGRLYVTNYNSNYVSRVSPEGEVERFAETPRGPAGVAVDSTDHVYVTIWGSPAGDGQELLRIGQDGEVEVVADDPQLGGSIGIAIDDADRVYVLSGQDGRILRWTRSGGLELFGAVPLVLGRGAGSHLAFKDGWLFAITNAGGIYRLNEVGALHHVLTAGPEEPPRAGAVVPPRSPLLDGINGLATSRTEDKLWVGCQGNGHRTLVEVTEVMPRATVEIGFRQLRFGQLEEARKTFEEIAARDDAGPRAWYGLAWVRYHERRFVEAADLFTRAAEHPPLTAEATFHVARALAREGLTGESVAALGRALDAGFHDLSRLRNDPDLEPARRSAAWSAIESRL